VTTPVVTQKQSARYSLRARLPLLIAGLIMLAVAIFLGVAYYEVEQTLVRAGGARAQAAADQLANLLAQSAQQRLTDVRGAAGADAVRRLFQHQTNDARAAALQRLTTLATAGQAPVDLWDVAGNRLLEVAGPAAPDGRQPAVPPASAPITPGLTAFRASGKTVFFEAVAELLESPPDARPAATPSRRLGFVRVRRSFAAAAGSAVISRLVGQGARVLIGNQSGDVWSDLAKAVPAPPVRVAQAGVQAYQAADGTRRLGASALIRGTPWAVWVEFPYAVVVAPARTFVTRMFLIGLCLAVAAAVAARAVSARITTPLHDLTHAAESIAAGNYSERVAADRRDEIGRLGSAFNAMTEKVEEAHRDLEARVQQRLQEVKEVRQELDQFFSLSLDLLCIADHDGYFKRVNPAWQDVLGWTADELTSQPYQTFVHPDDRLSTGVEQTKLADGGTVMAFENRYRHKDGTYRWLQWKAAPSVEQGIIYAAARDITEQKRAERAMQEHADALAHANHELEAFSYSVSHDLRAPLRHVTGFATLLERRAGHSLDEQGRRYLKTMVESASRMGRLIDDLLTFSRMGRTALAKQPVDLRRVVESARREVAVDINGRAIVWTIDPLPVLEADPAMLQLALVNLLSNAIKYTRPRAQAHIDIGTVEGSPDETVVFVRDDGVGFDMQYAHKLFGVFQRLHRADEFDGTGIGLANVRRIVERHGGRIWVQSEIDRGATFYFALPNDRAQMTTND
jgi:PAS domain S-box-containing protein